MDAGGAAVTSRAVPRLLLAGCALAAAGCSSAAPTKYAWGGYQDSLYRMYVHRDGFDPAAEAHRLSLELEQAKAMDRRVPPGVHAHLAYLCAAAGDGAGAAAHLAAEKAAFPESATFVDGMLRRMSK